MVALFHLPVVKFIGYDLNISTQKAMHQPQTCTHFTVGSQGQQAHSRLTLELIDLLHWVRVPLLLEVLAGQVRLL